jgi:hypothetical protein
MLQFWFVANTLLWPFGVEVSGFRLGLNVIAILLVGVVLIIKKRLSGFTLKAGAVLFAFTIISAFTIYTGPCTDKYEKFFITAPIFIFVILVGLEIGWRASEIDWLKLQKLCPWILLAAYGSFVAEFFGLLADKGRYEAYSGIFSEPSNVAYSLFPSVAILLLAQSKRLRQTGMLALVGLLLFARSSTLLSVTVAWIFYQAFMQRKLTKNVLLWVGLLSVSLLILEYSSVLAPFMDRLLGVAGGTYNTNNISSLVYLQGWQDVWANLNRTNGLGLGFNMMGCTPLPDVDAREYLVKVFAMDLNSEDGSFLFSKLVSETGVFGILFLLATIWWFVKLVQAIRKLEGGVKNYAIMIQMSLIFLFLANTVLRGGGYFNAAMLIGLVAVSGTVKSYRVRLLKESNDQSVNSKAQFDMRDSKTRKATK